MKTIKVFVLILTSVLFCSTETNAQERRLIPEITIDTIDVVLQVSDTSVVWQLMDSKGYDHAVYWRRGKEVYRWYSDDPNCLGCEIWHHEEYLDELGYPLPKQIIVWTSIRDIKSLKP